MAAATTATQIFQSLENNNENSNHEVSRQEIQAAIAKAVELRAIHASLMHGSSPANLKFPSSSPVSRPVSQFSAQDYPVFTPVSFSVFLQMHIFVATYLLSFSFLFFLEKIWFLGFCSFAHVLFPDEKEGFQVHDGTDKAMKFNFAYFCS